MANSDDKRKLTQLKIPKFQTLKLTGEGMIGSHPVREMLRGSLKVPGASWEGLAALWKMNVCKSHEGLNQGCPVGSFGTAPCPLVFSILADHTAAPPGQ